MRAFIKRLLRPLVRRIARRLQEIAERAAEEELPRFANHPSNLRIELPRRIYDADRMQIGDDVTIGPGSLLVAQVHYPTEVMQDRDNPRPVVRYEPAIAIGNRVTSTGGLTVSAVHEVVIEDDVMFAANVFVADHLHGLGRANEPYKYQPLGEIAAVRIGRGSWIGQNVVILPGVTIGELSVVGANSVVTRSIPSRCVAVGVPARVIKRWDDINGCWQPHG